MASEFLLQTQDLALLLVDSVHSGAIVDARVTFARMTCLTIYHAVA